MINYRRYAFTLSEVLITLVIIGVIAAITIPSLYAAYKKNEYVEQLKVAISTVDNGFKMIMAADGVTNLEDTQLFTNIKEKGVDTDVVAAEQEAEKLIQRGFKNATAISRADLKNKKTCKELVGQGPRYWNLGDKTQCSGNYNISYRLLNGMTMSVFLYGECSGPYNTTEAEILAHGGRLTKNCGMIDIDVNGERNPNQWGRDAFRFFVSQDGQIIPYYSRDHYYLYGYFDDQYETTRKDYILSDCNPGNSTATGRLCAQRIIEDNWQMNY